MGPQTEGPQGRRIFVTRWSMVACTVCNFFPFVEGLNIPLPRQTFIEAEAVAFSLNLCVGN